MLKVVFQVNRFFHSSFPSSVQEEAPLGISVAGFYGLMPFLPPELRFYVPLDTKQVILETFFPANLLA